MYTLGAAVTTWKARGEDVLWCSKENKWDGAKPIRAGTWLLRVCAWGGKGWSCRTHWNVLWLQGEGWVWAVGGVLVVMHWSAGSVPYCVGSVWLLLGQPASLSSGDSVLT